MKTGIWGLNGILAGLLAALLSGALVLGSFVLSITEASRFQARPAGITPAADRMAFLPTLPTAALASETEILPTSSPTTITAATATPSATACPTPPPDWIAIQIQKNDNLKNLAAQYGVTPDDLINFNCLKESQLATGAQLYVPASTPTLPAPTQIACTAQLNWPIYYVQPGDTLFNIAARVGLTVVQLMNANCLDSDKIIIGMQLRVPYTPAPIPVTQLPSPTAFPTGTPLPPDTATPAPTGPPPPARSPTPGIIPGTPPSTESAES